MTLSGQPAVTADACFKTYYPTSYLVVVGDIPQLLANLLEDPISGAGLSKTQIRNIYPEDYRLLWHETDEVLVFDHDNYEAALMASVFASHRHIPLVLPAGDVLYDDETQEQLLDWIENRHVWRHVGLNADVASFIASCPDVEAVSEVTVWDLEKTYINETQTNKLVLVNPLDIDDAVTNQWEYLSLVPEKGGGPVNRLYHKTSLAAPILAAARQAVLVSCKAVGYEDVVEFLRDKIAAFHDNVFPGFLLEYLTIVASPLAIPMTREVQANYPPGVKHVAVDSFDYADINEDGFPELAVGRIFGLTMADVASYVARVLHYAQLAQMNDQMVFFSDPLDPSFADQAETVAAAFGAVGYECTTKINPGPGLKSAGAGPWKDKGMVFYTGHGKQWFGGISYDALPELANSLIISDCCKAAGFDAPFDPGFTRRELFCAWAIRRGATGFLGHTDSAGYSNVWQFLCGIYGDMLDLGKSLMEVKRIGAAFQSVSPSPAGLVGIGLNDSPFLVLIGDPVFRPAVPHKLPKTVIAPLGEGVGANVTTYVLVHAISSGFGNIVSTMPRRNWTSCQCELRLKCIDSQVVFESASLLSSSVELKQEEELSANKIAWEQGDGCSWPWLHVPNMKLLDVEWDDKFHQVSFKIILE